MIHRLRLPVFPRTKLTAALLVLSAFACARTLIAYHVSPFQTDATSALPELVLQSGHSQGINCAVFGPDGKWLATAGADNSIVIWERSTGRQLRTLRGHSGYIRVLGVSPDGRWLASGANDKTIKLWDVSAGRELYEFKGQDGPILGLAFSPDNHLLASGSSDQTAKIWDLSSRTEVRTLKHRSPLGALAFTSDGKSLVTAAGQEVAFWSSKSWEQEKLLQHPGSTVTSIAFSEDGTLIGSGYSDGSVILWRNGSDRERFVLKRNATEVVALKFRNGSLDVVHSDSGLETWDSNTGRITQSLAGEPNRERLIFSAFSPDSMVYASGIGSQTADILSTTNRDRLRTLSSQSSPVHSVAFSRDGRWFASALNDASIRLWQVATGRELPRLLGHNGYVTTVAFSPDSHLIASGSGSGEVKVWDVDSAQLLFGLPARQGGVDAVVFSTDGKLLAVAGMNPKIELWDLQTKTSFALNGHSQEVTSLSFINKTNLLASAGRDKTIRIWDINTRETVRTMDNSAEISGLTASADGQLLAAASADNNVLVWDPNNATLIRTLTGHQAEVLSVGFSPDGQLLASAASDKSVILWDAKTGSILRKLKSGSVNVTGVAFSNNGRWLIGGSEDGSLQVWNSSSGTLAATLVSISTSDNWLVTTPDGLFDGSPESWGLMLWRFGGDTFNVLPVEAYFNEFYYPGVLAEIFADKNPKATQDIVQKDRRQPQIKIRTDQNTSSVATREVEIELEVSAPAPDKNHASVGGVRDLRLFRNGFLIRSWPGQTLKSENLKTIKTTIPIVSGDNRLSAYAFNNDNVKSLDATLSITGAQNLKRQGTAYLLMIGVAQYENAQYNLRYPVADASEMEAQLRMQQEKLGRYNPVKTITLTNGQATKANILLALNRLSGQSKGTLPPNAPESLAAITTAQPEDVIVIYFSGHGTAARDHFYIIPHDIGYKGARENLNAAGLDTILSHSLSDDELEEALRPLDADQLLLVIDACNSGQAIESEEKRRGPMNSKGLAQLAYEKGIYVLTASQSIEVAFEAESLKHSYLAYALLNEGIIDGGADLNRDGRIFLKEWFDYATGRVPEIRKMQKRQRKELVEDEADEQRVQRPRVFYTREGGARQFLIAQHNN